MAFFFVLFSDSSQISDSSVFFKSSVFPTSSFPPHLLHSSCGHHQLSCIIQTSRDAPLFFAIQHFFVIQLFLVIRLFSVLLFLRRVDIVFSSGTVGLRNALCIFYDYVMRSQQKRNLVWLQSCELFAAAGPDGVYCCMRGRRCVSLCLYSKK